MIRCLTGESKRPGTVNINFGNGPKRLTQNVIIFLPSITIRVKSKPLIIVALVIDILIIITKFIAAAITGSSAMVSEGIHSVIDATSQLLLLLGMKKSNKRADQRRPFGYGRELFFWSFIVSLIIFIVGRMCFLL
jgi:divalent metal cation (Fe/Co/Zn/Cd) transporter